MVFTVFCGLTACGAASSAIEPETDSASRSSTDPVVSSGAEPDESPGGAREPWEGRLVVGAQFELWPEFSDGGSSAPLVVSVVAVEELGAVRVYRLAWREDAGGILPTRVEVRGAEVVIGEATPEEMQAPWPGEGAGTICFAQDFSNPDGCDDVCDAQLCFSPQRGIVAVGGLYAPNYVPYSADPPER